MLVEEQLILNPLLGASVIWQCTKSYQECHPLSLGIPLPITFVILPLVFNDDTETLIKGMNTTSVLSQATNHKLKVIDGKAIKGIDIILGLQERCMDYSDLTWSSLKVALSAEFISRNEVSNEGFLAFNAINNLPMAVRPLSGSTYSNMLGASKRLGAWFSKQDISSTLNSLRIRF